MTSPAKRPRDAPTTTAGPPPKAAKAEQIVLGHQRIDESSSEEAFLDDGDNDGDDDGDEVVEVSPPPTQQMQQTQEEPIPSQPPPSQQPPLSQQPSQQTPAGAPRDKKGGRASTSATAAAAAGIAGVGAARELPIIHTDRGTTDHKILVQFGRDRNANNKGDEGSSPAFDLSGDIGAVGRLLVERPASGGAGAGAGALSSQGDDRRGAEDVRVRVDLKGHIHDAVVVPTTTLMVVTIAQGDAGKEGRIECLSTDVLKIV